MHKSSRFGCLAGSLLFVAVAGTADAQDATWLANPVDDDFNNPLNWSGGTVPTGTAVFSGTSLVRLGPPAPVQLGGITIRPGAGENVLDASYIFFTLDGEGIAVNGGSLHVINRASILTIKNGATTGAATISNIAGSALPFPDWPFPDWPFPEPPPLQESILSFMDDSNAGTSTILNGAHLEFIGSASASHASITNAEGATLRFIDSATLGSASVDNSAGLLFANTSNAGDGLILNRSESVLAFTDDSSAGNATIVNTSATLFGLIFVDGSTAGNATIITKDGGETVFAFFADGGTAAFETDSTSKVDFSLSLGPLADGVVNVGSLAGAGTYVAGFGQTLVVGGNNRSTEVSGTIEDGFVDGTIGGSLSKVGAGTLILSGINTYTGITTVSGGKLIVNGSTASSDITLVEAGATIGGLGTVGSLAVGAGGILAPGDTAGTLNVQGDLIVEDGAFFDVDIAATADRLAVTSPTDLFGMGSAMLGGTVRATYHADGMLQKRYTILTTEGGLAQIFAGVTSSAAGILPTLSYDADNVYLDNAVSLSSLSGLTDNQRRVAATIDHRFATYGNIPLALAVLDSTGLTQVSGEPVTAAMGAAFDASGLFVNLIGQPSHGNGGGPPGPDSEGAAPIPAADDVDRAFASRWQLWGAIYGGGERVFGNATVGSATLSATSWGVASGVRRSFDGGSIGVALGGAGTRFDLAQNLGSGSASSFNAGIHGTLDLSPAAYLSGALAWGYHATRTTRAVDGGTLSGRFGAQTLSGRIEAGYKTDLGGVSLIPYGALDSTLYRLPAYTETSAAGSPFALAFGRQSEASVRTELGARSSIDVGAGLTLTGRAAWVWNAQNARTVTAAFDVLAGADFTVDGAAPARHAALVDLGIQAAITDSISAKLTFSGEFSRNVTSYAAQAKIGVRW